jgi:lysozyme
MRMSDGGIEFLIAREGSIPHVYNDPRGFATFGVGHLVAQRRYTRDDEATWGSALHPRPDLVIPTLHTDLREREAAVSKLVRVRTNQNEDDALLSLVFNIGVGNFEGSTVLRKLNAGDRRGAADAFLLWRNPGLLPRRQLERALFLKPAKPHHVSVLLPDERRWTAEFDRLNVHPRKNAVRLASLRRVMRIRRIAIWHAAQRSGWDHLHRRERYAALLRRTSELSRTR